MVADGRQATAAAKTRWATQPGGSDLYFYVDGWIEGYVAKRLDSDLYQAFVRPRGSTPGTGWDLKLADPAPEAYAKAAVEEYWAGYWADKPTPAWRPKETKAMAKGKWATNAYYSYFVVDEKRKGYVSKHSGAYRAVVYQPEDGTAKTLAGNVPEAEAKKAVEEYWADKDPLLASKTPAPSLNTRRYVL